MITTDNIIFGFPEIKAEIRMSKLTISFSPNQQPTLAVVD